MARSQTYTSIAEEKAFPPVSNTPLIRHEVAGTGEGTVDTSRTDGGRHWVKIEKYYAYTRTFCIPSDSGFVLNIVYSSRWLWLLLASAEQRLLRTKKQQNGKNNLEIH